VDIKKQIAKLLAVVMFFSVLQNVSFFSLKAAELAPYNFKVLQRILNEGNPGLEEGNRTTGDDDTAFAQWEMSAAGEYVLSYYIQDGNQTRKVKIDLKYTGDKVTMEGTIDGIAPDVTERIFQTDKWINKSGIVNKIKKEFDIGTAARENREYNAVVNNITINQESLTIRVKVDTTKPVPIIQFYTNGIEKGYVNEFTLEKMKVDAAGNKIAETTVTKDFFNGPKNFKIMPVHLKEDRTTSAVVSVTHIDNINETVPGSRPGIRVSFTPIKYIKDGSFKEPTSEQDAKKVSIRLAPQYSSNGTNVSGDGSAGLRFYPVAGQGITTNIDGNEGIEGKVIQEGNELSL